MYECAIPSNTMNLALFDLCNVVLFIVVLVAAFNMAWHIRFYRTYNNISTTDTSLKVIYFTYSVRVLASKHTM